MSTYDYLPHELSKLGLKKQEADIYLVLLEDGYASISKLAEKTGLSRPTIYRILNNLQKKELISKEKTGSRNFFFADSPDNFLKILKIQKRKAEEQEREFLRIISILQGKYHLQSNKSQIKFLQNSKCKKIIFEDFSNTSSRNIRVIISSSGEAFLKNLEKTYKKIHKKMGDSVSIKEIYTFDPPGKNLPFIQRKITQCPASEEKIIIITDKVFLIKKDKCVYIEEEETIKYFDFLFNLIWKSSSAF
jgi:sugar-specific transcriptional regulator TrmB